MTKLVDLLAKRNTWPKCDFIVQDDSGKCWPSRNGKSSYSNKMWSSLVCADSFKIDKSEDNGKSKVTKEQWQEARNKLKEKKVNKDGWTRHRGGKCPVEAGTLVDVRYRDGKIGISAEALTYNSDKNTGRCAFSWAHNGDKDPSEIMAYRLHKPEVKAPEAKQELSVKFDPIALRDAIRKKEQDIASDMAVIEQWRSEVQCMKDKLKAEGFELVDRQVSQVDMNDPRNWVVGDSLTQTEYAFKLNPTVITRIVGCNIYTKDKDGSDSYSTIESMKQNFKFHSRP